MIRACENCSGPIRPGSGRKSCSKACARAINSKKAVELRRIKKYGQREPKVYAFSCVVCGVSQNSLQPRKIVCSGSACRETAKWRSRSKYRVKAVRISIQRTCPVCSSGFSTWSHLRRSYCSVRCSSLAKSKRARATPRFKKWTELHRPKTNASNRERDRILRSTNPAYRLRQTVRTLVKASYKYRTLTGISGVWTHLGYSPIELREHIESFFNSENGFTWENHGEVWELEHVTPQSWFVFTTPQCDGFKQCWSLSNLRPDHKDFNRSKSNRFAGSSTGSGVPCWKRQVV